MPKKDTHAPQLKSSSTSQVLSLVKILLSYIGSVPVLALIYLSKSFNDILKFFKNNTVNYSLLTTKYSLDKKRGRPRKTPLYLVKLRRLKLYFKRNIPTRVKFGVSVAVVFGLLLAYTVVTIQTVSILPSPTK